MLAMSPVSRIYHSPLLEDTKSVVETFENAEFPISDFGMVAREKFSRLLNMSHCCELWAHNVSKGLKLQKKQNRVSGVREVAECTGTPSVCARTMCFCPSQMSPGCHAEKYDLFFRKPSRMNPQESVTRKLQQKRPD